MNAVEIEEAVTKLAELSFDEKGFSYTAWRQSNSLYFGQTGDEGILTENPCYHGHEKAMICSKMSKMATFGKKSL